MVALDLRGHGFSEKPNNFKAYEDARLWADDLHAVIEQFQLTKPILVGASYGGIVISDYLRYYGADNVSGICFVGAIIKSDRAEADAIKLPTGLEFRAIRQGLDSESPHETAKALETFINILTYKPLSIEDFYFFFGFNAFVPSYVRKHVALRAVNNEEIMARFAGPILVIHGQEDYLVSPQVVQTYSKLMPQAQICFFEETGHYPQWEEPERFNKEFYNFLTHNWC